MSPLQVQDDFGFSAVARSLGVAFQNEAGNICDLGFGGWLDDAALWDGFTGTAFPLHYAAASGDLQAI